MLIIYTLASLLDDLSVGLSVPVSFFLASVNIDENPRFSAHPIRAKGNQEQSPAIMSSCNQSIDMKTHSWSYGAFFRFVTLQ